ncbi:MAG: FkbM family methyltransferase [Omnitrophica bacterium]|nr:FkbM family methyltransferase [Candidatus Omnitrophota bacterium]
MMEEYTLPNGMRVYHINEYETKFIYKEIFKERTYVKNGISLDKGVVVFDVGANIGLFTLFIKNEVPHSTVYAFEPATDICEILQLNVAQYEESVIVSRAGLSDKKEEAIFTYYPNYSILSGFHGHSSKDRQILRAGIENQLDKGRFHDHGFVKDYVDSLIENKLGNKKEYKCNLTTISAVIDEYKIPQIDLLKIDAEKSEEKVLKGISGKDWIKIKQIIIEVHDPTWTLTERIKTLLEVKGFKLTLEEEQQFKGSGIVNIFAIRAKP